jgi:hypothetical protein
MTEVIHFHHALGVTDGVMAFADQLRDGGSEVPGAELFLCPGSGHLFTDRSWKESDEASTTLVMTRSLAFLGRYE